MQRARAIDMDGRRVDAHLCLLTVRGEVISGRDRLLPLFFKKEIVFELFDRNTVHSQVCSVTSHARLRIHTRNGIEKGGAQSCEDKLTNSV